MNTSPIPAIERWESIEEDTEAHLLSCRHFITHFKERRRNTMHKVGTLPRQVLNGI
jgi:hypothetical protein